MLKNFKSRLFVSLGVLLAPLASVAAEVDVNSYETLKNAIDAGDTPINFTDNVTFDADGATLDIGAATTINGAAYSITSNTDAQTPIFNVADGTTLTITGLTLQQAINTGENSALLNNSGDIILQGVTLQNSVQAIVLNNNGSITIQGDDNTSLYGTIAGGENNTVTKNGTGAFNVNNTEINTGTYYLTAGSMNLTSSTVEADNNKIEADVTANGAANKLSGATITIGTENAQQLNIADNASLEIAPTNTATIGQYSTVSVGDAATLTLNAADGTITSNATGFSLGNESVLTVNGSNAVTINHAITTVDENIANINFANTDTVTLNGDMSGANVVYNQTAGTVEFADDSKFFNGVANVSNSTLKLGANVDVTSNSILNLNGNTVVTADSNNNISASSINVTNAANKINGFEYTIDGVAQTEDTEAKYTTINIGNDEGTVSELTLAPSSKTEQVFDDEGEAVLDEEGQPTYEVTYGSATLGAYTKTTVYDGGSLTLDTDNGNINILKNATENDNAITNNGSINITGTNSVTTEGIISGNGSINKDGSGAFNINNTYVNAKAINMTQGSLNLNGAHIDAETNSLVLNSISALNSDNKITGHEISINGISADENLALTVGDDNETASYLLIAPSSKQEAALDDEKNPILDEEGNPTYNSVPGSAVIGQYVTVNVKNGSSLELNSDNGTISIAKNADADTINNSGTLLLTGTNSITTRGSVSGNGTLNKSGSGEFNVIADTSDTSIVQNNISLSNGNVNLTGATVGDEDYYAKLSAENLNMTSGTLNLNGNAIVLGTVSNISAENINALNDTNQIGGHNLVINGSAPTTDTDAKYVNINVGDGAIDSRLTIAPAPKYELIVDSDNNPVLDEDGNQTYNTINGNAVIGSYTKINVLTNGTLELDSSFGDIAVNASDNAISLADNSTLELSGDNIITLSNKIETPDEAIANVVVAPDIDDDNPTVNINANMSNANVYYTQNAGTVNLNNEFFAAQAGSEVTGGIINFNEGAAISTDNLKINGASAVFNSNSVSKITAANFAKDGGTITYGDNSISLAQADITLNDGYILSENDADITTQKIEIGQATQGIKTLTLQNSSIGESANINIENGTLNLEDGSSAAKGSSIAADANSVINLSNDADTLYIGANISGTGTISKYDAQEPKTNLGLVQFGGDNSGFTGKYIQNTGIVEFTTGSTFFGDGFTSEITGAELKIDNGVNFTNTASVIIPVIDSAMTTDAAGATADLSTRQVSFGDNQAVKFELQNSKLNLNKNVDVVASTKTATIGNDGSNNLITALSLGDTDYTGSETVNIRLSGDNVLNLINVNADENVGTLTIGNNVNIETDSTSPATLTTNLGDNTILTLKVAQGTPLDNKVLALGLNAAQADNINDNAKVVKAGTGNLILGGNNNNFNGTLQVDNGTVTTADNTTSLLGLNVKYSLQNVEKDANISLAPLHDVNVNPDMSIIGINLSDNASANIYNTSAANGTVTVLGDTLVDNNSALTVTATDTITLANTKVGSASESSNGKIDLTAKNIIFNNVDPVLVKGSGSVMTLNGDSSVARDFILKNATLNLNGNMFIGGDYSVGSTVNMINNQINTQTVAGNMTLTGNTDYKIDVNGIFLQSDKVVVGGTISAAQPTILDISQVNLITEPKYDNTFFQVFNDANTAAGQEVDPNVVFSSTTGFIDAPVGRYVMNSTGNGRYLMSRIGYNPYVLAGPVAAQAGYYTQLNAYNLAFSNADMILALPKKEREAYKNANKYAAADELLPVIAASDEETTATDVNVNDKAVFEPSNLIENQAGGWFRPYGIFENVKLKDGPEVGNNMYGAYVGTESMVKELGHGFEGTLGVYAGYDGSHQTYEGVGIYQNGGTLGITGALYKDDFFNLTTANIGASGAEQKSNYGSADFWLLRGGIANKTGYNWNLADGKFIIQPHLLMSISSVNLFSYEAAPNIKVDGESLFTWQIAPGVKFIGNTENGWQPYASVDMLWNVGGKSNNKANGISLPEMYSEPWIEYGLGMQKRWGERFTGYGQAMFRNIGRNGVAFTAGLRWKVGEGR